MQFEWFIDWLRGVPLWIYDIFLWIWGIVLWLVDGVWAWIFFLWDLVMDNFIFLFKGIVFPGLIFVLFSLIFFVWWTRKLWGRIQARRGPVHLGKYGGIQIMADAIKLLSKEVIIPDNSRRWMYRFLPCLLLILVLVPFAFIPWDPFWYIADLSVSLVLVFAFLAGVPVVALLAGWVTGSKYSLIGGFRAANNQFASEIPMIIASVGPAMLAGSLSLLGIATAQTSMWFVLLLPLCFVTFLVASIASVGTFPFDAPVADSEIIFGWRTEFTGIYFTLTYFAEFAEQMLYSALMVALFFGGFYGLPFLPGYMNFIIKFLIVFFFFVLVSSSFFRLRQDQIVHYCWKYLLPLSLLNVVLAMLALVYIPGLAPLLAFAGG
ncbi:MAG: complex I subunit 1/NuoH family protein [Candidatus Thorarchaeota archaeon]